MVGAVAAVLAVGAVALVVRKYSYPFAGADVGAVNVTFAEVDVIVLTNTFEGEIHVAGNANLVEGLNAEAVATNAVGIVVVENALNNEPAIAVLHLTIIHI